MSSFNPDRIQDSDATLFRPSAISTRAAQRSRLLAIPREPVEVAPGRFLTLAPVPDPELWLETGAPVQIELRIDGETLYLQTVQPVIERILHDAEPRIGASDLDAELSAALLEAHLQPAIEAFETELGVRCAAVRLSQPEDHDGLARLDIRLDDQNTGAAYPAVLFGSPHLLGALAAAWSRRPLGEQSAVSPCFMIAARIARCHLSRAALTRLAVGDCIMFDRIAPDSGVVICVGEHIAACAQITENGSYQVHEPFSANSPLALGDFFMSDEEDDGQRASAIDDTDIGSLPVNLVFELGRMEMSLDQLREIGIGTPIALDRPASSSVEIIANGRRIGAGEMVLVGDQLGVRITRLNGHA